MWEPKPCWCDTPSWNFYYKTYFSKKYILMYYVVLSRWCKIWFDDQGFKIKNTSKTWYRIGDNLETYKYLYSYMNIKWKETFPSMVRHIYMYKVGTSKLENFSFEKFRILAQISDNSSSKYVLVLSSLYRYFSFTPDGNFWYRYWYVRTIMT